MNRRLLVDVAALVRNYEYLRDRASPASCAAVIKADAYGLGIKVIARELLAAGCNAFFVATVEEGVSLRSILPGAEIYVLEGVEHRSAEELLNSRLIPVLNTLSQAEVWARRAAKGQARCILHIDTGMTRLGLCASDLAAIASDRVYLSRLSIDYLMTHLACADEPGHDYNVRQQTLFTEAQKLFPGVPASIANSSGIFLAAGFHGGLVRPGIALFGSNPQPSGPNPMQEVVQLQGRIIQIREVEEPARVGYGGAAEVEPPARLATVAIGYADGYPRALSNRGHALVDGVRSPILGRISMDSLVADISAIPSDHVSEGDWATMIGGGIDLDCVAAAAGTISYEILCGIGQRVPREYKNVRQKLSISSKKS